MDYGQNLKLAVRVLRRRRSLTVVTITVLMLGIGVNGAIFSVINAVLLWRLPFRQPESIALISGPSPQSFVEFGGPEGFSVFEPALHDKAVFESVAASVSGGVNLGEDPPIRLNAAAVTPDFFHVLGINSISGRTFTKTDIGGDRVAIISYRLWRQRLVSAKNMVGRSLNLNNRTFTICGVMPPDVDFPSNTDVWIPASLHGELSIPLLRPMVIARLRSPTSFAAAHDLLLRNVVRNDRAAASAMVRLVNIRQALVGDIRLLLLFLAFSAALVLVAACVNASIMTIARVAERDREFAVRLAIGASPLDIVYQVLCESLVLAGVSGVLALLGMAWTLQFLRALVPPTIYGAAHITLNGTVIVVTAALIPIVALSCASLPAWSVRRRMPVDALRTGEAATKDRIWVRFHSALVVGQLALAFVLLCGTATLLRTVITLARIDLGVREDNLTVVEVALPRTMYVSAAQRSQFYDHLERRLRLVPGILNVGITNHVLLGDKEMVTATPISIGNTAKRRGSETRYAIMLQATPGYFATLGIELLAGRIFTDADLARPESVALVSDRFTRVLGVAPTSIVGQQIRLGAFVPESKAREIIGVVRDVRIGGPESGYAAMVYTPFNDSPALISHVLLKTASTTATIGPSVRRAVAMVDPSIPIFNIQTFTELRKTFFADRQFAMRAITPFGALALVLAFAGVFGVISHTVELKRREVGIRLAVGASPRRIRSEMLAWGARRACGGILVGLACSVLASRWMSSTVTGVWQIGPAWMAVIAGLLFGFGILASWIPAERASRVDPTISLRAE